MFFYRQVLSLDFLWIILALVAKPRIYSDEGRYCPYR